MKKRATHKRVVPRTATQIPKPYVPPKGIESGLTKNQILSELSRSPHGNLQEYVPVGKYAAKQEPEFFAHLLAWNRINGQIRDSHVALPVVSLTVPEFPSELAENSFAHIALLSPRELDKAYRFALELRAPGRMLSLRRLVTRYLREKESDQRNWDRVAVQHRGTLKSLYSLTRTKPSDRADAVLFKQNYPPNSVFEDIHNLKNMSPADAATAIVTKKIPFLIASGALGKNIQQPDLVMALINSMSSTELVTNTKMLEKLGLQTNPVLRAAYEKGLEKASKSKKNVLKTTRAAESITDETLKAKLQGLQDRQIAASAGIEGNWLVLSDKSGSMSQAIEIARHVAATLSKYVKGKISLVFFDTAPQYMDVTGKSLEDIKKMTQYIRADGGTSIGCGLQRMLDAKEEVDGIAIVSDGGENTAPLFAMVYKKYSELFGKEIPVYLYHCDGDSNALTYSMQTAGIDMQVFEISRSVDYYSLPNLISTMRTQRYGLVEEIMSSKLLTLDDVFKSTQAEVSVA